jgi:hypothetical protein
VSTENGQGDGTQNAAGTKDDNDNKPIGLKDLESTIGKVFNKAWSDRESQSAKAREKAREQRETARRAELEQREEALLGRVTQMFEEKMGGVAQTIDQRLRALAGGGASAGTQGAAAGAGGTAGGGTSGTGLAATDLAELIDKHPALAELKRKLEAAEKTAGKLKSDADNEKKLRELAQEQQRAEQLVTKVTQSLTGKDVGVAADRAKVAMTYLKSEGRLRYEDNGKGTAIVFVKEDGEEVPLLEGLKEWAKSDEAQIFLPAKNPGGSGGGPARARAASQAATNKGNADPLRAAVTGGIAKLILGRN